LLAYLLALFAKTTACTLPAALVLVFWLRGRRFAWPQVAQILPFLLIGLAMGVLTVWWEGHLGNFNQNFDVSLGLWQRLLLASNALWFYAGKLFWPANLAFSYPHWEISPTDPWQYLPLAGCLVVAALAWRWRNKIGRAPVAGLVFFVAALSPLLGFAMEYTFRYSYVADHYQYNASIGLLAITAAVLCRVLAGTGGLSLVAGAILLVLGGLTWQQCGAYHDFETLWRDTVAKNPQSWMAHHNLGIELSLQGKTGQALKEYQAAVVLHPNGDVEQGDLGGALLQEGRSAEALTHLEAAAAINPRLFAVQNNLALAYANEGDLDQSVNHFRLALQITNAAGTLMNFGGVLVRQGKLDEAIQCYREVAASWPTLPDPWRRLGAVLATKNDPQAAIAALREGLLATSNHPDLLLDLGNFYFRQTNYVGAAECFQNAIKAEPANAGLRYNLALVYGKQGDLEAERRELQTTVDLRPDFTEAKVRLLLLPKAQPK